MKIVDTLHYTAEELGLKGRTISIYGRVNGVNVRVSDHMPKVRNLVDYAPTWSLNSNGEYDLYFSILCDELYNEDNAEDLSEELKDDLEFYLEVPCNVDIFLHPSDEDYDTVVSITKRDTRNF